MSLLVMRGLLQLRLATMSPLIKFVYENDNYTPLDGTPYAEVTVSGEVSNPEFGDQAKTLERWNGQMLVLLRYPADDGFKTAQQQAEAVKDRFPRRLTLTATGGTSIIIHRTPDIRPAFPNGSRYCVPVIIHWFCNLIV